MSNQKRITSDELARLCAVSQGTVDRALNNRAGISEKTKRKILETAEKCGYIKNMRASALVKGKSGILGLIVLSFNNEYFASLATSIEKSAEKLGYSTMIAQSFSSIEKEKQSIKRLCGMGADGIIMCSVGKGSDYAKFLNSLQKPILGVSNKLEGGFPFVGIDDYSAMRESVFYAAKRKYKKLVLYSPTLKFEKSANIYAQRSRYDGFLSATQELNLRQSVCLNQEEVLSEIKREKCAILCTSDYFALKLMQYLKEFEVGKDYALMSFDNIEALNFIKPRLTSVNYSTAEIGEACVKMIVSKIMDNKFVTNDYLANYQIIEGETML